MWRMDLILPIAIAVTGLSVTKGIQKAPSTSPFNNRDAKIAEKNNKRLEAVNKEWVCESP